MRASTAFLIAISAATLGCRHSPALIEEPVVGQLDRSDAIFLADDPAANRHCSRNADCPAGSLCGPENRCFSDHPMPRMLEVLGGEPSADHGPCRLVSIYFPFDSAELVDEARRSLEYDARCLRARGTPLVILVGFADARGKSRHNVLLSRRRGEVVRDSLRRAGLTIPIGVVGKGESTPLMKGETELSLAYNRRVEIRE